MRNILFAAAAALSLGMLAPIAGAQASPLSPAGGLLPVSSPLGLVQNVQFSFGGHRYCWYPGGWRGAGWYRCGFSMRRGQGWGGPAGWRGWRHPTVRPRAVAPRVGGPSRRVQGNRPGIRQGARPGARQGARPGSRPGAVQRPAQRR